MYCSKCGKQIDYNALVCKECENAEMISVETEPKPYVQPIIGNRKEGFKHALVSTIVGSITFFLSLIALSVASVALEEYSSSLFYNNFHKGISTVSTVLAFLCIGGAIPALILGIMSIRCFICAKNEGRAKPVATLVCGIVGVVMSALTFFLCIAIFSYVCYITNPRFVARY